MKLGDLDKRLRELASDLQAATQHTLKDVASEVLYEVVSRTPILTGRARVNWQVQLGAAPEGVRFPAPQKPPSPEQAYEEAVTAGLREIGAISTPVPPGVAIHITNNVPYIGKLNSGYSEQAPAGFVEAAIVRARLAVDKFDLISTTATTEKI